MHLGLAHRHAVCRRLTEAFDFAKGVEGLNDTEHRLAKDTGDFGVTFGIG